MIILGKDGWIGSHLKDDGKPPVVNCVGVQPARGHYTLKEYLQVNVVDWAEKLWDIHCYITDKVITLTSQKTTLKGEIGKLVITDNCVRDIMEWYHQTHGLQTIVLSLPPVYGIGPYLANSGLGAMMECAKKGEPIELWGDTSIKRDFISIHDVVTAIECLADSDTAQGEYCVSGGLWSLREEGETVKRVLGSESEIVYCEGRDNGLEPSDRYHNQKRIHDLGWKEQWSFERIVRELKDG